MIEELTEGTGEIRIPHGDGGDRRGYAVVAVGLERLLGEEVTAS